MNDNLKPPQHEYERCYRCIIFCKRINAKIYTTIAFEKPLRNRMILKQKSCFSYMNRKIPYLLYLRISLTYRRCKLQSHSQIKGWFPDLDSLRPEHTYISIHKYVHHTFFIELFNNYFVGTLDFEWVESHQKYFFKFVVLLSYYVGLSIIDNSRRGQHITLDSSFGKNLQPTSQ